MSMAAGSRYFKALAVASGRLLNLLVNLLIDPTDTAVKVDLKMAAGGSDRVRANNGLFTSRLI